MATVELSEALAKFLADVERQNGQPVVVGPWGFKKVRFGGKLYLMAMSKEELQERKAGKGAEVEDLEEVLEPHGRDTRGYCTATGFATCVGHQCPNCQMDQFVGGFTCYCP